MITPQQTKIIQTISSQRFNDRDERIDFLSAFCGTEINSIKELTEHQAYEVIRFLKTGQRSNYSFYARFVAQNKQHRAILSLAHQLGWVNPKNPDWVDLERLGTWLISKRCPVRKPIREMTKQELSKVIFALEQMILKHY